MARSLTVAAHDGKERAITLGHPSYVWRFGQNRRLELIRKYAPLEGKRVLDVGCGVGMYLRAIQAIGGRVYGVDIDCDRAVSAHELLPNVVVAPAEQLPFVQGSFDVVLLHEVLEHVEDDRCTIRDAFRVLSAKGRMVIFAPNRLYPLETHGVFWRGQYHFGNIPLINWLPDRLRAKLAPHVRVYTAKSLVRLFAGLSPRLIVHIQIFPGYDKIAARWPALGRTLREVTYFMEKTPMRRCGLSHFLVMEKQEDAERA
jgi:SAM-dependent methyltransferase